MRKPYILAPGFVDPFEDRALLEYFARIVEWHGYIRFLGLTAIWDTPDLAIERLFVAPRLSERLIAPQADNDSLKETHELYTYLRDHPRLVVLGDPGSGKSTLVSWLASRLTVQDDGGLSDAVGRLVPFPMVLRELDLSGVHSWDTLWSAFMRHEVAAPLRDVDTKRLLTTGQAFVMLDGIDELAGKDTRELLRSAVREGMESFRNSRWLLTSRVLGYDEVPFHKLSIFQNIPRDAAADELISAKRFYQQSQEKVLREFGPTDPFRSLAMDDVPQYGIVDELQMADVAYAAPFDDGQIARFAANWYAVRDSRAGSDSVGADEFIQAISGSDDTRTLARTPNLLTMMVLVHRNRAVLPHGKAALYEEITKAYLGGIDAFRKLDALEAFDYAEKRAWLGAVALHLQRARSAVEAAEESDEEEDQSAILIERNDLRDLLTEAIARKHPHDAAAIAERFLDFVARRSGLLIPRDEKRYAFVHLSFQEFFAAVALRNLVVSPSWHQGRATAPSRADLARWAGEAAWTETFVFLFGLLREEPEWDPDLLGVVFGEEPTDASPWPLRLLAVRLAHNEYAALDEAQRDGLCRRCWRANGGVPDGEHYGELGRLLVEGPRSDAAIRSLRSVLAEKPELSVRIRRAQRDDLLILLPLPLIRSLDLSFTPLSDLSPLSGLASLSSLDLAGTGVTDLSPLSGLASLSSLDLAGTKVSDLSPLSGLASLSSLDLWHTNVTDLSPLSGLASLSSLDLGHTNVTDLSPLSGLASLSSLGLIRTGVTDLSPLSGLASLSSLDLRDTGVTDLSPVAKIRGLRIIGGPSAP